jgi:hypothetical protein
VSVKIVDVPTILFRNFIVEKRRGLGAGAAADGPHPEYKVPPVLLEAMHKFA